MLQFHSLLVSFLRLCGYGTVAMCVTSSLAAGQSDFLGSAAAKMKTQQAYHSFVLHCQTGALKSGCASQCLRREAASGALSVFSPTVERPGFRCLWHRWADLQRKQCSGAPSSQEDGTILMGENSHVSEMLTQMQRLPQNGIYFLNNLISFILCAVV